MRRIVVFFIVLILVFFVYRASRHFLVPYLQKHVSVKTGQNISIGNFSLSPFKLSLKDVDVNGIIKVRRITFKLNLFKFLFNVFSPMKSVRQIEVSNIEVDLKENQNILDLKSSEKKAVLKLPETSIDVYIDEVLIRQGATFFNISDAHIHVDTNTIKLDSVLRVVGHSIKLEALLKQKEGYLFDGTVLLKSKNKDKLFANSKGTIDLLSFNSDWDISLVKLNYKGFNFGGSSGTLSKNEKGIDVEFVGNFGKSKINGLLSNTINAEAFIDLSKTSKFVSGKLNINFRRQKYLKELNFKVSKLNAFNFNIESFELLSSKNNNGIYKIICNYGSRRRFEATCLQDGDYEGNLIIRDKKAGYVKGNIKTGIITVDSKNVNVTDFPLTSVCLGSSGEMVNISGNINETSGKIECFFLSNMNVLDAKGTVIRDKDKYTFNFYKLDDSVLLKYVISDGNIMSADFKFKRANFLNVLQVIGYPEVNISGTVSGNVSYRKGAGITFDIKACDGTFYGNDFREFEVKGEMDLNKIEIERFVIKNNSNTSIANVKGLIGLTYKNPDSYMYIDLKNITVRDVKIDCRGEFSGHLSDGKVIKGVLKGVGTKIGGVSFGGIDADVDISTKKIELLNLKSDNGLNATFSVNLKKEEITGVVNFKNTNIEGACPGIAGFLNASVNFSGKLNNPYIEIFSLLKKGTYLSHPFSLSSAIFCKDGIVNISKMDIISGRTKLFLKGTYSNVGCLQVSVNNLNENIINTLTGFASPFKYEFSGKGEICFRDKSPELKMFLETKYAYVTSLELKDLKTEIEIVNKNIAVKSASANVSDGKIRIDKSFYDLNNNQYCLDLSLINIYHGPMSLFGNIKISGDIIKETGSSIFSGIVDLNNLWINEYRLKRHSVNYSFKGGELKLFQKTNDKNNDFNLSGEIIFGDNLLVKRLNTSRNLSYFDMSGNFSKDHINFEATGHSIDWKFMSNLFSLPVELEGDADVYIKLKGDVNSLYGNMKITSTNGTLMNVPFDKLGIHIDFDDGYAHIKEAFVLKRNNGINIVAKGNFPIRLSKKASKEVVDISYNIEDNNLGILKYLSSGFLSPLNGKLLLKGTISGSYKNLKNNGTFSVFNGTFRSNDYIDKIKNASIEISLTDNLIEINKFTFNSGTGKVNIAGQIKLENFIINNFDIRVVTEGEKGIPIHVPQSSASKVTLKNYLSGTPLFDVKITGTPQKPLISGQIILENSSVTFYDEQDNKDFNFLLPDNTELDLDLRAGTNTKFVNSNISAFMSGVLHISGGLNSLKSEGIINLTRGKLNYYGIEFDKVNAKLEIIDDNQVYITAEGEAVSSSKTGRSPETTKLLIKRCKLSEFLKSGVINFLSKDNLDIELQGIFDKTISNDQNKETNSLGVGQETSFRMKQFVLGYFNRKFSNRLTGLLFRKVNIVDNFGVFYAGTGNNVSVGEKQEFVDLLSGMMFAVEKAIDRNILIGYNLTCVDVNRKYNLRQGIKLQCTLLQDLFFEVNYEFDTKEDFRKTERAITLKRQLKF